jgi:hypothetical protein
MIFPFFHLENSLVAKTINEIEIISFIHICHEAKKFHRVIIKVDHTM